MKGKIISIIRQGNPVQKTQENPSAPTRLFTHKKWYQKKPCELRIQLLQSTASATSTNNPLADSCSSCTVSNFCVQPEQEIISIPLPLNQVHNNFSINDIVEIKTPSKFILFIAWLTFLLPLFFMISGAWWGEQTGGENTAIAFGFAFLLLGLGISFLVSKNLPAYKIIKMEKTL